MTELHTKPNFEMLVEKNPDHIMLLDLNLKVLYVNYTVGKDINELIGSYIYSQHENRKTRELVKNTLEEVIISKVEGYYEFDYEIQNREIHTFQTKISPIIENDNVINLLLTARDITKI